MNFICFFQDVVQARTGYLQNHEHYQNCYSNAKHLVESLKKQLKTCSDVAGNKTDNEDKLKKLKVSFLFDLFPVDYFLVMFSGYL